MEAKEYQNWAVTLDREDYSECIARLNDPSSARLNHAAYGLVTEAGELMDVIKRHVQYGTPIDWTNVKEEISDILWYCALACKSANCTLEQVMDINHAKLSKRYGGTFSEAAAINRDVQAERKVLES